MHKPLKSEDFWTYSINVYGISAVKNICLTLQDTYGADVNMLLLCCWLDQQNISLSRELVITLRNTSVNWQNNTLQPLRVQRRTADKKSATYQELLQQELKYERQEQKELIRVVNDFETHAPHASHPKSANIQAYATLQVIPEDALTSLIDALPNLL